MRETSPPPSSLSVGPNFGRHACFAMGGMHATTPPSSRFQVLDVAIEAVETLRPVVGRIRQCDRDLGEQIRRALSSIALNIGEANRSEGGNRISRFSTAAGSNAEVRAALRVAVAWCYVSVGEVEPGEMLLDRIAAMLHRLGARR
jgi:four helix bundle protein